MSSSLLALCGFHRHLHRRLTDLGQLIVEELYINYLMQKQKNRKPSHMKVFDLNISLVLAY